MTTVALGDICEFVYGKALPKAKRREGAYSVYGSNGVVGSHTEPLTGSETIVIGRKGSVGQINFSDDPCWPIDTTYFVDRSSTSENMRWLFHALNTLNLPKLSKATGVPGLNRSDAYQRKLFRPGPEDQVRIAAILDKADAIRRKREQLMAVAAVFVESAYVRTVGHLNPDYDVWEPCSIEQLAQDRKGAIRSGPFGSALRHGEFVNEGIAVLGIDNAVQNKFGWGERRYITEAKYDELRRYRVYPNDVIITIMGTTGRSAVVPHDIPEAITTKHLATITCDLEKVLPEVLSFAIHSDPMIIRQIKAHNKGAIMDGLNLGIIKQLVLKRPPMEEQRRFSRIVRKIGVMLGRADRPNLNGEDLFFSLSQLAFRGEL